MNIKNKNDRCHLDIFCDLLINHGCPKMCALWIVFAAWLFLFILVCGIALTSFVEMFVSLFSQEIWSFLFYGIVFAIAFSSFCILLLLWDEKQECSKK